MANHVASAPSAAPRRSPGRLGGLLREARPKQWAKNVLVFAAPGAAGQLGDSGVLGRTLLVFAAFCCLASGLYFLNDLADVEADRLHPRKRRRPIASGVVPVGLAIAVATLLLLTGLGLSAALGWRTLLVGGLYVAATLAYSARLKHEVVLDLACVASGFVLRAIAGGTATNVLISKWFLIVAGAGSMFMVAGKRHAEFVEMGEDRGSTRVSLQGYTLAYLRFVWMLSSSVAIGAYALWAFEDGAVKLDPVFAQLSIVPFTLALLRYALDIEQGHGGAPEDVVLGDRALQALGLVWLVTFAVGVHLGG
ncbi:MAG: decaprenyl-phosphate phosphoribosyltransferase [Acidimicrobiales bacterium]